MAVSHATPATADAPCCTYFYTDRLLLLGRALISEPAMASGEVVFDRVPKKLVIILLS